MSAVGESLWDKEVARAVANAKAVEAFRNKPVTVGSYFDALEQLEGAKRDLITFGGKYGATNFRGSFDLRKVIKAYTSDPEARAVMNRIAGVV